MDRPRSHRGAQLLKGYPPPPTFLGTRAHLCRALRPVYTGTVFSRLIRGVSIASLAVVGAASPVIASAHNNVVETTPSAGETITTSPVDVSLTTLEILLDLGGRSAGFAMVTRDQAGLYYGTGCVELTEDTMSTTVELGEPGDYEVVFQLVGADGHTISDRWSFTYAPTGDYVAAQGQSSPPVCGADPDFSDPAHTPTPAVTNEPASSEVDSTPGPGTLIAGVVGALAAIGAISDVLIRRKRR